MSLLKFLIKELSSKYNDGESRAVARVILEDLLNLNVVDVMTGNEPVMTDDAKSLLYAALDRLKKGEPVQYVIGFTWFGKYKFNVTPETLIPRPETKELVDLIINENKSEIPLRILDIGTGSGCIAISLSLKNPLWSVEAWDVSEGALKTAIGNAVMNNAVVDFKCKDLFLTDTVNKMYDIIVSNPPYITPSEKCCMDRNVLDYEPHLALFVPQDNPLLFYREIAEKGLVWIKSGGRLYFEINRAYYLEIENMLHGLGYVQITSIKDYNGNYRFVRAVR